MARNPVRLGGVWISAATFGVALLLASLAGSSNRDRLLRAQGCGTGEKCAKSPENHTGGETPQAEEFRIFTYTPADADDHNPDRDEVGNHDPETETVTDENGATLCTKCAYKEFDPFDGKYHDIAEDSNGGLGGGVLYLWKQAPYGDMLCKGWFGTHNIDIMSFDLLPDETRTEWRCTDCWDDSADHTGIGELETSLFVKTTVEDIGGQTNISIKPKVESQLTIRNVGGGDEKTGVVSYEHKIKDSVIVDLGPILSTTGHLVGTVTAIQGGKPTPQPPKKGDIPALPIAFEGETEELRGETVARAHKVGEAKTPAEIEIVNRLTLSVLVDDALARWEVKIKKLKTRLEINH